MEKDPEELLGELLVFEDGVFPRATLKEIIRRRGEMDGPLLAALGDVIARPEKYVEENSFFPIYLVHLLAQFRVSAAYRPLVALIGRDDRVADELLGDLITENLSGILASVFDGDEEPLRSLVENPAANEYVRVAALDAMALLAETGRIPAGRLEEYFGALLEHKLEREPSVVWDCLALDCGLLRMAALLPLIEEAFDQGLCDSCFVEFETVEADMHRKPGRGAGIEAWLVDDTIGDLEGWYAFGPKPKAARRRHDHFPAKPAAPARASAAPAVGRNDPCPCGSGKKYKKCCGDAAKALETQRNARARIGRLDENPGFS